MSDSYTLPPEEDDFLDGCDLDFTVDPDDDETSELRALFPNGEDDRGLQAEWEQIFRDPNYRELAPLSAFSYVPTPEVENIPGLTPPQQRRGAGRGRDLGIADRLRAFGLKVVEVNGWQTRGSTDFGPRGSVDHHTAGPRSGNAPSLGICINGRSDLPGPLCNVYIARDNTVYVVAAGRANHAGTGGWGGLTGNSSVFGVERENTGVGNEPWTEDQRITAARVHAALLSGIGRDGGWVCEHKEWTTRKIDAWDQSGDDMRSRVRAILTGGSGIAPAPGPVIDPVIGARDLRIATPYMRGDDVRDFQKILVGAKLLPADGADGIFGPATDAAVRQFQINLGIPATGVVDALMREKTHALLAWLAGQEDHAADRIKALQKLVGAKQDGQWGPNTEAACKKHMVGWNKKGVKNEPAVVRWLQQQGPRKGYAMDVDGRVGPQVNHFIVIVLGESDGICGPNGFRKAAL